MTSHPSPFATNPGLRATGTTVVPSADALSERFRRVRVVTERLAAELSEEDCALQSMADASPIKWHLAHTSWFLETFLLEKFAADFTPFDPAFRILFNSYYNSVGDKHPRVERGLISRPKLSTVFAYRHHVTERIAAPLYWHRDGDVWDPFTLRGMMRIDPHTSICHVSYFEADAYTRWQFAGLRLARDVT